MLKTIMIVSNTSFLKHMRNFLACVLCCLAGTFSTKTAQATPLDAVACAALQSEWQGLKALEVEKLMANGPQWAASNLSPGDINLVRHYIEVDETIKFRCKAASAMLKLRGLDEGEEDGGANTDTVSKPAAAKKALKAAAPVQKPAAVKPQKPKTEKKQAAQPVQATLGTATPAAP